MFDHKVSGRESGFCFLSHAEGPSGTKDFGVVLARHLAPVGDDALPGDERGLVGSQEVDDIGDLVWFADPIQWDQFKVVRDEYRIFEQIAMYGCVDEPG